MVSKADLNLAGLISREGCSINDTSSVEVERVPTEIIALIAQSQEHQETKPNWHERAICRLNKLDKLIDDKMGTFGWQTKLDQIGELIQEKFAPLQKFNTWLDDNGHGEWFKQLATFLLKLPMRAVRNIIKMVYAIIETLLSAAVHPVKALNKVAKLLVTLVNELSKPETWSKMGAGMMGASLGQALITANPLSVVGMLIGAAMIVAGVSFGALKAAVEAKTGRGGQAAKEAVLNQVQQLPEAALTGFLMGLLIGAIQKSMQEKPMPRKVQASNQAEAQQIADDFVQNNKLPKYSKVTYNSFTGETNIEWNKADLTRLVRERPELFYKTIGRNYVISKPHFFGVRLRDSFCGPITEASTKAPQHFYGAQEIAVVGLSRFTPLAPISPATSIAVGTSSALFQKRAVDSESYSRQEDAISQLV